MIRKKHYALLLQEHPYLKDFFLARELPEPKEECTMDQYASDLPEGLLEDRGILRSTLLDDMNSFLKAMDLLKERERVTELEIRGGLDKKGMEEPVGKVILYPGDVISVVGPTGSGKSRLLEDIECLAQGDTPTGRTILINGEVPDKKMRFSLDRKQVAQISQNMNFVMDCSVREFLLLHAESRMIPEQEEAAREILVLANILAGETFTAETALTGLSGGQSRALMIADTACLSRSPIVLIDEIENAGVDRKKALELLVKKEKIILLATHDPLLALMADRRIIIRGGSMSQILETTEEEKKALTKLEEADRIIMTARGYLRTGRRIG